MSCSFFSLRTLNHHSTRILRMVTWMERETRSVENEEYLGDAPYCSLFPSLSKIVIFFLKLIFFLRVNAGVMKVDTCMVME